MAPYGRKNHPSQSKSESVFLFKILFSIQLTANFYFFFPFLSPLFVSSGRKTKAKWKIIKQRKQTIGERHYSKCQEKKNWSPCGEVISQLQTLRFPPFFFFFLSVSLFIYFFISPFSSKTHFIIHLFPLFLIIISFPPATLSFFSRSFFFHFTYLIDCPTRNY